LRAERAPLLIAGALIALLVVLDQAWLHVTSRADNALLDIFVRTQSAPLSPDPDIVIVAIDDASLARLNPEAGAWPWPRAVYAELVAGLAKQQPRAIVFDILFSEADRFRPESDAAFIDALRVFPRVYVPMSRLPARDDAHGVPLAQVADAVGLQRLPDANPDARAMLEAPLALPPELWRTGTIDFVEDADGVGRRYRLFEDIQGWRLRSLPARVAADLGYAVPPPPTVPLAWRGAIGSFRRVSFADLYEDFQRAQPSRAADEFKDRIVIIGATATGLNDLRATPRGTLDPGVEILATAIDNLKNGRVTRIAPPAFASMLALVLIATLVLAFWRGISAPKIGVALLAASWVALGAALAAAAQPLRLPVGAALAAAWLYYLLAAVSEYRRERRARERAVRLFGRFLNTEVVRQLVERGETVESLSGKPCEISVLFSDIRGFTSLAETRPPQEVVKLLNRYFERQTAVVFRHGGTLDKYIGDCIMAFWGAPLPDAAHAQRAVACALEMERTLLQFRAELGAEGEHFDVGIGIHTGAAVVGFIGAEQKLDYTAIGDTVNLASRVEGLTKGIARTLITADTRAACGDAFTFVPRGAYSVKGRVQPVDVYEPQGSP
jgi:adenylate cyclase